MFSKLAQRSCSSVIFQEFHGSNFWYTLHVCPYLLKNVWKTMHARWDRLEDVQHFLVLGCIAEGDTQKYATFCTYWKHASIISQPLLFKRLTLYTYISRFLIQSYNKSKQIGHSENEDSWQCQHQLKLPTSIQLQFTRKLQQST